MGVKKKHPEHENLERWLVSYADFITLLFATFTALYALSQADLAKMKDVSAAIREGFQEQSIMSGIKSVLQGKSPPSDNPKAIAKTQGAGAGVIGKYDSLTYSPGEVKKVEKTYQKLKQAVSEINQEVKAEAQKQQPKPQPAQGSQAPGVHKPTPLPKDTESPPKGIDVSIQERGLRISFDSRLLFEPGTAVLKKESEKRLDAIAANLKDYNLSHMIHVEGHTDDQPIASAIYPSNWELSAARASTVVRYLIRNHGFSPNSLVAVGYGASQPLASNNTPEGRRMNRRVDIIIYSKKSGAEVTPSAQYAKEEQLIKSTGTMSGGASVLIRSEDRDSQGRVIPVVIQERDGTQHLYAPAKPATARPSQGGGGSRVVNPRVAPKKPSIKPVIDQRPPVPPPPSP